MHKDLWLSIDLCTLVTKSPEVWIFNLDLVEVKEPVTRGEFFCIQENVDQTFSWIWISILTKNLCDFWNIFSCAVVEDDISHNIHFLSKNDSPKKKHIARNSATWGFTPKCGKWGGGLLWNCFSPKIQRGLCVAMGFLGFRKKGVAEVDFWKRS